MTCLICSTVAFHGLPMHDKELLALAAREMIQGMLSGSLENFKPKFSKKHPGTCMVERCARFVETACGGCRTVDCPRCAIAAELRAAEDRINAERDAEIATLNIADQLIEEILDQLVENLCEEHGAFGPALFGEWHGRRNFMAVSADVVTS